MTLIAAQIKDDRIEILADGLSCHDKLTIIRGRTVDATTIQTDVPGRTTLQKIVPHPSLAFAIVHCGSNQREGMPVRAIIERFHDRAASEEFQPAELARLFEEEFGNAGTAETFILIGWQSRGIPIVRTVGSDFEMLVGGKLWAGSGRKALSRSWTDLDSLQRLAERFLGECQKQAPFGLPLFANCYGGHWHRLRLTPDQSPRWLKEPRRTGIEVSALIPGPSWRPPNNAPTLAIINRGGRLKEILRGIFKVTTIRGALERTVDEELQERLARIIAIFDEVHLDHEVATVEDAQRYETAVDDAIVRLIEREVLDKHYRQCALLSRNESVAVDSLLRCYARILRDLRSGQIWKPTEDGKSRTANEGLRGLSHSLRWIKERCPSRLVVPTTAAHVLAQEALELLQWGVRYDPVWNQHSAYSRGLLQAEADELNKTISFLPRRHVNPHYFCTQVEAKKVDDERLASARPDAQVADLSSAWYDSVTFSEEGMRSDDSTIRTSGAIEVASSWMESTCLPELAGATRLLDCTVGELRRVLATLYVYSLFVTKLEDVSDNQPTINVKLPPCVAVRPRDQMIKWLAGISGVRTANVEAIVKVLTFDPTHPHVTLAQQPLVQSDDGQLFFLPRMLLFLDLPRMYVGALHKIQEGRAVYERTINGIEAAGVKSIAGEICAGVPPALQIVSNVTFCLPENRMITPDIVVVSQQERTILVIDLKYSTPPFGPADIHRRVEEFEKWKVRMGEYVSSFQKYPTVLGQHFQWVPDSQVTVVGLILTRWPLPIPVDLAEPVSAVDWPSLHEFIRTTHPLSIRELIRWTYKRSDVAVPALEWTTKVVEAAEWRYRYSVMTPIPK
jgi:hypothetical protein